MTCDCLFTFSRKYRFEQSSSSETMACPSAPVRKPVSGLPHLSPTVQSPKDNCSQKHDITSFLLETCVLFAEMQSRTLRCHSRVSGELIVMRFQDRTNSPGHQLGHGKVKKAFRVHYATFWSQWYTSLQSFLWRFKLRVCV